MKEGLDVLVIVNDLTLHLYPCVTIERHFVYTDYHLCTDTETSQQTSSYNRTLQTQLLPRMPGASSIYYVAGFHNPGGVWTPVR